MFSHELYDLIAKAGKQTKRDFGFDESDLYLELEGLVSSFEFLRYGYQYMDDPDKHDFLSVLFHFEDELKRFQNRLDAFLCHDDLKYASPSDRPAIASNE